MKKTKKYLIAIIGLCGVLLSGCFKSYKSGVYVFYSGVDYFSCNNRYKGELDYSDEPIVTIYDKETKKVKSFKRESMYDHIVLGEEYFFLFTSSDSGEKTKIVRYTYNGEMSKMLELEDVVDLSCKNGILFIGCGKEKPDDTWRSNSYMKGFWANYYIEEKNFGQEIKLLDTTKKRVEINDVTLYYHGDRGYFCTEPDIGDYEGRVYGEMKSLQGTYQGALVYEHIDILKEKFHFTEEAKVTLYEYQDGYYIYGCCNLMNELINPLPMTDRDVNKSWCFRINGQTKELEVLEEREKALAMYCTEESTVYYKDKFLYCENRKTGKRKKITEKRRNRMSIRFDNGYVLCDDDSYVPID